MGWRLDVEDDLGESYLQKTVEIAKSNGPQRLFSRNTVVLSTNIVVCVCVCELGWGVCGHVCVKTGVTGACVALC